MSTTLRKTAKGLAEIETRAHRLAPRMRSMLILVDGKRSRAELRTMLTVQADETLEALEAQGFIEAIEEAPRPAPPPAQAPAPSTASASASAGPSAKPAAASPAAATRSATDNEAARRAIVRALLDELGPPAEPLAMRIERARGAEELRPLLAQAVVLVQSLRGRTAAAAFAAKLPEV